MSHFGDISFCNKTSKSVSFATIVGQKLNILLGINGRDIQLHIKSWIRVYKYSHISLILEIFPDFAGLEVPDFDETIHASCDQELTIWREGWALHVGLLTKLCGFIKEEGKCKKLDRKNCRYHDLNPIERRPSRPWPLMPLPKISMALDILVPFLDLPICVVI